MLVACGHVIPASRESEGLETGLEASRALRFPYPCLSLSRRCLAGTLVGTGNSTHLQSVGAARGSFKQTQVWQRISPGLPLRSRQGSVRGLGLGCSQRGVGERKSHISTMHSAPLPHAGVSCASLIATPGLEDPRRQEQPFLASMVFAKPRMTGSEVPGPSQTGKPCSCSLLSPRPCQLLSPVYTTLFQ